MASTADIKNGVVLNIDGQLWSVIEFQHVKPGKGGAFVRTKLKNVVTGKVVDRTFNAGTKIEIENVDRRDFTVPVQRRRRLRVHGRDRLRPDHRARATVVGDAANFMLENQAVTIALNNGDPLYVELPASVVLEITYTEPGLQGDRSTGGTKPATRRDRLRDPGAAVPRDGHEGQGRHPHGRLPRPRERLVSARTKARKRALDMLYAADMRQVPVEQMLVVEAETRRERARARARRGCTRARSSTASSTTATRSTSSSRRTRAAGRSSACPPSTGRCCASACGRSSTTTRCPTPVAIAEAVEAATVLSTDDSAGFVNGLLAAVSHAKA